jgi:uncharacterized protein (DUF433 family)
VFVGTRLTPNIFVGTSTSNCSIDEIMQMYALDHILIFTCNWVGIKILPHAYKNR